MTKTLVKPPWAIVEPRDRYDLRIATHLNSHRLSRFRKCPRLFRVGPDTPLWRSEPIALVIGRAFHALMLEGTEAFDREFIVGGPINPKTGKAYGRTSAIYKQWVEASGRVALDDETAALLARMEVAVRSSPHATALLAHGLPEATVLGRIEGVDCQARIDWVHWTGRAEGGAIVDLKTCGDLDEFEQTAHLRGYIHQLAFYRAVVESASDLVLPCRLVAVEKRAPVRCGVWHVDAELLARADDENRAAVRRLAECRRLDEWPTGFEAPRQLSLQN
jgi:hypothetical protein